MPPTQTPSRTPTGHHKAHKALHERSDSQKNVNAGVRLVPYSLPRLSGAQLDDFYSRSALPTLPAHFLPPTGGTVASYQGAAFALQQSGSDVSAEAYQTKPQATTGSGVTTTHQTPPHDQSRPSTANSSKSSKPLPKKRKHVALNPDNKTFRVLDVDQDESQTDDGPRSSSSLTSPSSHDSRSFAHNDFNTPTRSSASCALESSAATTPTTTPAPTSPAPISTSPLSADHITNSPWNYQFVGGLRKVPKTPDLKHPTTPRSEAPLPSLPETADETKPEPNSSATPSIKSSSAASTISENSNYRVYESSPTPHHQINPPPSSSNLNNKSIPEEPPNVYPEDYSDLPSPPRGESNYQVLSYSSPSSSDPDLTSENYHIYGDSSPSASYVNLSSPGRPSYSRDSLIVPPLRPKTQRSKEGFGYYKSRSRESLRTGSLTSISTVLGQEAIQGVLASGTVIQLPATTYSTSTGSWAPSLALTPARSLMQAHPHQWSSQLSTVPSESDGDNDQSSRRWSDGIGRRSSGFPSNHSRQMASISSSIERGYGHSRTSSLEAPQPVYVRSTPRLVEDPDEHGDGITDMQDLRLRPSRTRLSEFFNIGSDTGRTYTMRSNSSSRANSLLSTSIPAWAKLYYGSGERKYLGAPGSSTEATDSRPQSSFRSGSPDTANFPLSIYSPRRRPRQLNPNNGAGYRGSMEISSLPELGSDGQLIYNPYVRRYRPSSSVLSPHLKRDRRATRGGSQFFMEPASIDWSTEGNVFTSRRKRQMVLFVIGFIFPFGKLDRPIALSLWLICK